MGNMLEMDDYVQIMSAVQIIIVNLILQCLVCLVWVRYQDFVFEHT